MRKAYNIFKNIFFTKTPIYVIFFVTSACNAKCRMCFNWKNIDNAKRNDEMGLEEIKRSFRSFSSIQQLTISGGEPFLREDLPEILGFISKNNNVQMVTIPTNALLPEKVYEQTARILDIIPKYTHLRLALSVEGVKEKHDKIVQVKGAFSKVQQTYIKLKKLRKKYPNMNMDIAICCSAFNKKDIIDTIKYCNDYFEGCTITTVLARGDTRDKESKDVTIQEYKEITDFLDELNASRKRNKPFAGVLNSLSRIVNRQVINIMKTNAMPNRCYAYSKMIVIQSNGDVFPCEYLNRKLGNLKENDYDIRKILRKNKEVYKFINNKGCSCTWECALFNNIVCNPRMYPLVLYEYFRGIFKRDYS